MQKVRSEYINHSISDNAHLFVCSNLYIYIQPFPSFGSPHIGSNLSASENQSEFPAYSDTLPLHLQPARPLQHLPGNIHKVIHSEKRLSYQKCICMYSSSPAGAIHALWGIEVTHKLVL